MLRLLRSRIGAGLRQPLIVSAAASSLSGALATLIAAHRLSLLEFAMYASISLVLPIAQGALRSLVHEPTLVLARSRAGATIHFRSLIAPVLGCGSVVVVVLLLVIRLPVVPAALILGGVLVTWIADWVRYRLILNGRRWTVATGDLLRFPVTLILLLPMVRPDAAVFAATVFFSPVGMIVVGLLRSRPAAPTGERLRLRKQAFPQTMDFFVLQLSSNIPLLLLGSANSAVGLFAVVRLSQTLLGPLNFVFMAISSTLMADGATERSLSSDNSLIRHGKRQALLLCVTASAVVVTVVVLLTVVGPGLIDVDRATIALGAVLVGAGYVGSGWAGLRIVVLRLLGQAVSIVRARVALVTLVLVGYLTGVLLHSLELSIVLGLATSAVAYPTLFGITSARVFRRTQGRVDS